MIHNHEDMRDIHPHRCVLFSWPFFHMYKIVIFSSYFPPSCTVPGFNRPAFFPDVRDTFLTQGCILHPSLKGAQIQIQKLKSKIILEDQSILKIFTNLLLVAPREWQDGSFF